MVKEIKNEKFIVRIHGEVNKEKLLEACKTYCQKVNFTNERGKENEKIN